MGDPLGDRGHDASLNCRQKVAERIKGNQKKADFSDFAHIDGWLNQIIYRIRQLFQHSQRGLRILPILFGQNIHHGKLVLYRNRDPVHHHRRFSARDIALQRKEQIGGSVHDVQPDDLLDQIPLQQQIGESDAEQNHRHGLLIIFK